MRFQYPGWPIHPLGLAVGGVWMMDATWFTRFLAWLLRSLILRYGSNRRYQRLRPVFLGLICGQFTINGAWPVADHFTGKAATSPSGSEHMGGHPMSRFIELIAEDKGFTARAELWDDKAPLTCRLVWDMLPVTAYFHHAIYSGPEVAMVLPEESAAEVQRRLRPGEAYRRTAGRLYTGSQDRLAARA